MRSLSMASCTGNSSGSGCGSGSGSSQLQNSGSEEDVQVLMEQRKRKRMQSNRESARRSRMRKQKHLDDLSCQVSQLKKENNQICARMNIATQHCLNVEAENCVLRAQLMELSQRLDSLNEILNFINKSNGDFQSDHQGLLHAPFDHGFINSSSLNCIYLYQPIMASPHLFRIDS